MSDSEEIQALVRRWAEGGELETRLRLTLGLRNEGGRWLVAHEHHSFADTSGEG